MRTAAAPLSERVPDQPEKLSDKTAVWSEIKDLAGKYNCLSLGEGTPNLMPPKFLKESMIAAIEDGHNQYLRTFGAPQLVTKVAQVYGAKLGREVDPMKEVLVTLGANGALMSFISAYCNKGDEVVTFEPMFPMYLDHGEFAGGKTRGVPLTLQDGDWKFDPEQLRAELSKPTTKVFLFNTPHNPTGKVFTVQEMQQISDILDDCPHVLCLSDEVYDFLTFDGLEHNHFATVGNNWDRTVTIFSGGKLFYATGWKVGWAIGPARLIRMGGIVANTVYYTNNAPAQVAFADSLDQLNVPGYNEAGESFVQSVQSLFQGNRDRITAAVNEMALPWKPVYCPGGYFVMADITPCRDLIPAKYLASHDYEEDDGRAPVHKYRLNMPDGKIPLDLAFCRWMACEKGVTMMPNCFFYAADSPNISDSYVRLAICKDPESTVKTLDRLRTSYTP